MSTLLRRRRSLGGGGAAIPAAPTMIQAGDNGAATASGTAINPFAKNNAGGVSTTLGNAVVLNIYTAYNDTMESISGQGTWVKLNAQQATTWQEIEQWVCLDVTTPGETVTPVTTDGNPVLVQAYEVHGALSWRTGGTSWGQHIDCYCIAGNLAKNEMVIALAGSSWDLTGVPSQSGWTTYDGSGGTYTNGNGFDSGYAIASENQSALFGQWPADHAGGTDAALTIIASPYSAQQSSTGLSYDLGTNDQTLAYGDDPYSFLEGIDAKWVRIEVPWNWDRGGPGALETAPGTYNSSVLSEMTTIASDLAAVNAKPLWLFTCLIDLDASIVGMCPTVSTALSTEGTTLSFSNNGGGYGTPFAITTGDTIDIYNYNGGSPTLVGTVVAAGNAAIGATSVAIVASGIAASVGYWIYDTAWPPCTPSHFAAMVAHMVGLYPGQHWELFNEPDLTGSPGIDPTLYTQTCKLAYPAAKAADSTCIIHAFTIASVGWQGNGWNYMQTCYEAGILGSYDVSDVHMYANDWSPDSEGPYNVGSLLGQLFSGLFYLRSIYSDTTPYWITETGWDSDDSGSTPAMTTTLQASYMVQWLLELSSLSTLGEGYAPQAVIHFELFDGGAGAYGAVESDEATIKPLYTALETVVS